MQFINHNEFKLSQYRITPKEYWDKNQEQPRPIVLDIRPLKDSAKGVIDGTYPLPHEQLEEKLIQLPPFGTIVLFSNMQNDGIEPSMRMLWENGFTEILYVDGGYSNILKAMFQFSATAEQQIAENFKQKTATAIIASVQGQDYSLELATENQDLENHIEILLNPKFSLWVQHANIRLLKGATVDYQKNQWVIDHPRMHEPRLSGTLNEQVQALLDQQINPQIAAHGGFVKLLNIEDSKAYVEMGGGCQGCGMSKVTLKHGIETTIKDNIPEIFEVLDVTDHAAGTNPYYQPDAEAS